MYNYNESFGNQTLTFVFAKHMLLDDWKEDWDEWKGITRISAH
jgi:hypothetical protein